MPDGAEKGEYTCLDSYQARKEGGLGFWELGDGKLPTSGQGFGPGTPRSLKTHLNCCLNPKIVDDAISLNSFNKHL
uniref:Uncharacterized protein n=1 Tax=Romanomermis culicivorax TaxID=13658 RepID=A0A915KA36_ROMCU